MLKKQFIIDVEGDTPEALAAALCKAGQMLATGTHSSFYEEPERNVSIRENQENAGPDWAANTLYYFGTDAEGKVGIRGTRSSTDSSKDIEIMTGALELSQAVELRDVTFTEHRLGGLLVRPAPKSMEPAVDTPLEPPLAGQRFGGEDDAFGRCNFKRNDLC